MLLSASNPAEQAVYGFTSADSVLLGDFSQAFSASNTAGTDEVRFPWFHGASGEDVLVGGVGDDLRIGGDGDDLLLGGFGSDLMIGNAADDARSDDSASALSGSAGQDWFFANVD